ncbi:MAG TPA: type I restriction enzyme HsdR N-terminal domain-containing protein [Saprospiraceae bacterium]|nr:type I restriction enzyme HsdR N-terminal domain-containing protein [Saprospiraceae bacterium]
MVIDIALQDYQNQIKTKKQDGKTFIFDPVRKTWLVLLPEELVRQLMLQFLVDSMGYKWSHFRTESGLKVNEQRRRTDIIAYDQSVQPYLLVECKAPHIKINENTFWQSVHYNRELQAPFLVVTNGIRTYCCEMDYTQEEGNFLAAIPRAPF